MVPDTREWRTSSSYDFMDEVDTDNLAWECLRRNANYQKDFSTSIAAEPSDNSKAAMIQTRWCLRFPRPPQPLRARAKRILDA
ncbi:MULTISPECIES: transcriptional regulator domain-containing protein [Brucella]|uniref:transcriptional regulator domain-containing protein n=1 Tax=Brucella TaxID=234 RepID=UPI0034CD9520